MTDAQRHPSGCDCQVCTGAIRKPGGRPPRSAPPRVPQRARDDREHPVGCRCARCVFDAFAGKVRV